MDATDTVPETARLAEVSEAVVRACVQKGWLALETVALRRNPWESVEGRKAVAPPLTALQQQAVQAITGAVEAGEARSFLLFGVTGSGKTEVFLHAIEETLARGRQVIVLVPEISLTAQAMSLYHGRFPGKVAVLHSNLSPGERFDEWGRIARGEAQVVLGARSAIFAPCPKLGLIVIDEEHESSYKQESSPRYHAKAVALERGRLCSAPVVLASATPNLESMREAELGHHTLLRLPERIADRPLPPVKLVDLKRMTANARILSHPLRVAIGERLAAGQQVILFLNRRGFSYSLLCSACGFIESCPHCALPLTYHKGAVLLRCHHCDYSKRPSSACPNCKGAQIAFRGVGTERLEAEVQALWPQARLGPARPRHHRAQGRASRNPRALRTRRDGYPHRHADGRQGLRLPQGHAGGRHRRRYFARHPGFPRAGAHLPTAHPGGRTRRARRMGGRGDRANFSARALRHPGGRAARLRVFLHAGNPPARRNRSLLAAAHRADQRAGEWRK